MPQLKTAIDTKDEAYLHNRHAQLAAVAALDEQLDLVRAGGGARYAARHHERGKLLVRENS